MLKPRLFLNAFNIQELSQNFNLSESDVKMYSLTFVNPVLISSVDGVISIEMNIN